MASIKISSLPKLTDGTLTPDDQFIINDGNTTTSRLSYGDFQAFFLGSNLTFSGSVNFDGDINIVESLTSNVLTRNQVVAEVKIETDRALAAESELAGNAAADATNKSNDAKNDAIAAAAADATNKANDAKNDAISAAAADATNKANDAKNDAIDAASADATNNAGDIAVAQATADAIQTKLADLDDVSGADVAELVLSVNALVAQLKEALVLPSW